MEFDAAKAWLQKHVPAKFWEQCENMWIEQNLKYRTETKKINEQLGLSSGTSILKLMSYWGAVSVPQWATKGTSPEDTGFMGVREFCLRRDLPPGVARLPIGRPCCLQRLHGWRPFGSLPWLAHLLGPDPPGGVP